MSNVLLEGNAIYVLALLLVNMFNGDNLDERVEVNRVVEETRTGFNGHNGVFCAIGEHLSPFIGVDIVLSNDHVYHSIQMVT